VILLALFILWSVVVVIMLAACRIAAVADGSAPVAAPEPVAAPAAEPSLAA
jgi:hypothetical protein